MPALRDTLTKMQADFTSAYSLDWQGLDQQLRESLEKMQKDWEALSPSQAFPTSNGGFVFLRPSPASFDFNDFFKDYDFNDYVIAFIMCLMILTTVLSLDRFRNENHQKHKFTQFKFQENKRNSTLVQSIISRVGDYVPPTWYSPHIGTLVALGSDLKIAYERQVLHESSTELVCVDWYPRKPPLPFESRSSSSEVKIAIVFPGLGLSSNSKFIKKFVANLSVKDGDLYCAVLLTRGVGCKLKSATRLWNPGMSSDGERLISYLHSSIPAARLYLFGFSAGTNIVKTILNSPQRLSAPVHAGFCVAASNAPYPLSRAALERTLIGRIYSRLICGIYKDIILSNDHIHREIGTEKMKRLRNVSFLSEYDEFAAAHLYQYPSQEEYHVALSGGSFSHIRYNVPFLILQPHDDPLHQGQVQEHMGADEFSALNCKAIYMQTRYGNHFGFYEDSLWKALSSDKTYTYPARVASVFLDHVHSAMDD